MNRFNPKNIVLASLLTLALTACDSIPFLDTSPDYKGAGRSRPLEVPPDLTSVSSSDTFSVPNGPTTYSTYSQDQSGTALEQEKILPNADNVRLERAGSQRWLVVDAPAEKVWPVIREFWTELGFAVRVENPQTGVMETEWVDPSNLTQDDKGNYLDKFQGWLDKLNSLKNRQKFRTRIDRGEKQGSTEIFMSHRSISDVPDDGKERVLTSVGVMENGYALKKPRTKDENDIADAEDIDAELLRRLMVRLGVEEKKSRSVVAAVTNEQHATVSKDADGSITLATNDQFDRAWRRVGLALDRVGFVVEDRDRSKGLFFVRYLDAGLDDEPEQKKGLLDTLKFWGDDDKKQEAEEPLPKKESDKGLLDKLEFWKVDESTTVDPEKQYRVKVANNENGTGSQITIVDKDDKRNRSNTANRIMKLLYEQLK